MLPASSVLVKDRTLRRVIICFLLISVILVVVAIFAVRNINRSVAASDWVNQSHEIILESQGLLSSLREGDAALRTFLLTGDTRDQIAARDAFTQAEEHGEVLSALTRGEPAARAQVAAIGPLVASRAQLAADWAARRSSQAERVNSLLAIDVGPASIGEIKRRIDKLRTDQMALLAERDKASYLQAQAMRWTVWAGVGLNLLLLAVVSWLIRDDLAARRRAATALEIANQQLDRKVAERTSELVSVNQQLATENLERQWANHALEHQLRYDQLIVNSIGDLVFVLTKVLNISRINPAVVQRTGFESTALINRPLSDVVRLASEFSTTGGPMIDPMLHALRIGRELRDEPAILKDRRGSETPVRFTLCPLRDGNKIVGGVVILQVVEPPAKIT